MTVCRTCLLYFESAPKYIISHSSEENFGQDSRNSITNGILIKTMIEKCMPEMDLDICDSPVICDRCYELLLSAYKFRLRCVETEEKIYNYIETNNLRLGVSIDLNLICEKNPYLILDERINDRTKTIKDEIFEYEEMPVLQSDVKPNGTGPDTKTNEITNNESEDTQNEVEININTNKDEVNSNMKANESEYNFDGFNSDEENNEGSEKKIIQSPENIERILEVNQQNRGVRSSPTMDEIGVTSGSNLSSPTKWVISSVSKVSSPSSSRLSPLSSKVENNENVRSVSEDNKNKSDAIKTKHEDNIQCSVSYHSKRGRKRRSNMEHWKRNVAKMLRNTGQAYENGSKKRSTERKMKPSCSEKCKIGCGKKFTEEERLEIFKKFWGFGNLQKQRQFIANSMEAIKPKYRYIRLDGKKERRANNNAFYFYGDDGKKIRICKSFFKNTLDISDRPIRTVAEKKQISGPGGLLEDRRGKHGKHRKKSLTFKEPTKVERPKLKESITTKNKTLIDKIPKIETDYMEEITSEELIENHFIQRENNLESKEPTKFEYIFITESITTEIKTLVDEMPKIETDYIEVNTSKQLIEDGNTQFHQDYT